MNQPAEIENPSVDTEAIAARAEAATPGPWRLDHDTCDCGGDYPCEHGRFPYAFTGPFACTWGHEDRGQEHNSLCTNVTEVCQFTNADADFIAHARSDIPTLLAALATAEERAEKLGAALREIRSDQQPWNGEADWDIEQEAWVCQAHGMAECKQDAACIAAIALANYHKATGPQAAPEIENAQPGATGEGS